MLVRAIAKGHYKSLREIGDEFDIPQGMTGSWFVPVEQDAEVEDDQAKPRRGRPPKASMMDDD